MLEQKTSAHETRQSSLLELSRAKLEINNVRVEGYFVAWWPEGLLHKFDSFAKNKNYFYLNY